MSWQWSTKTEHIGQPENCSAGGGGGTWTPAEGGRGGGVGEMGFRVGPFVLCKNGCWRQRHRNTKFGPKKFFSTNNSPPPPHLSSQNDQRDVGIILSHRCWVDPPPPPARQVGHPRPELPPPVTAAKEGGGGLGKWASVSPPPPPPAEQFSSRLVSYTSVELGRFEVSWKRSKGPGTPSHRAFKARYKRLFEGWALAFLGPVFQRVS